MSLSAPPELAGLQAVLSEVFRDPRGARAAAAARPRALRAVRQTGRCSAATRLSVYGDGYFLRMLEALSADYPAALRLCGSATFRVLAAEYITAHPSTSPSLADLGERFPAFVAAHRSAARRPWLGDLARLERAVSESLLTDRLPPLSPQALAAVPAESWSGARLRFDPAARLLTTAWPVLSLWRGGRKVPRKARPQRIVVARAGGRVLARALSREKAAVLERLRAGSTLAESLAGVSQAPGAVQAWFSRWIADGLLAGVSA